MGQRRLRNLRQPGHRFACDPRHIRVLLSGGPNMRRLRGAQNMPLAATVHFFGRCSLQHRNHARLLHTAQSEN
jgi:hypothetical protein